MLAELPVRRDGTGRPGTLSRAELEVFRRLGRAVGDAHAILVAGGERRADVSVGLAVAALVDGRRVALLECDLARPGLAARLGLSEAPGLAEYLRFESAPPRLLQTLVPAGPESAGAAQPLVCVVAGRQAPDAAALLTSDGFAHAIETLRDAYDSVIVDGTPLRDERCLSATAGRVDRILACCGAEEVPEELRARIDGLVVP